MSTIVQGTPGYTVAQLLTAYQTTGNQLLNPTPTSFIWGQYVEVTQGGVTTYEFTGAIIVTGHDFVYDTYGLPVSGTMTEITVSSHFTSETSNPSHADVSASSADFHMAGVNLAAGPARSAVFSGDQTVVANLLRDHQWTYTGSDGNDRYSGGDLADTLRGNAGNDKLGGSAGNDTLDGGIGADYLSGGSGSDRASYLSSTSALKVSLATASQNTGEAAGDTYNSIENLTGSNFNDSLTGSNGANRISGANGNDVINGLAGNDVIFGGSGNDRIYGHLGNDTLEGGVGNDTFIFHQGFTSSNVDTIADFEHANDALELWSTVFTTLATGTLSASAFKDMALSAKDADDRIIYNSSTGILYYDSDGSGTAFGNVKFAVLAGKPTVAHDDFVIV